MVSESHYFTFWNFRFVRFEVDAAGAVANHSTRNLRLSWISETPYTRRRRGMRDDQQLIALQFTPATRVRISQLNEVDRSFILVAPRVAGQFVLGRIDLEKSAGADHGIHREVGQPEMSVKDVTWVSAVRWRYQTRFV